MEKKQLKSGYTKGFLPKECNYKNYTMLVAIANYSSNPFCSSSAEMLLDETCSIEQKERYIKTCGSFMHAVCTKDFATAWNRADGSNREALIEALKNNEIEL